MYISAVKEPELFYWLNNDSRTFLSRDYLLPGVSAEERVYQIANHSKK
jgi:ribonucleoside-diphosphate reductase alpha chain